MSSKPVTHRIEGFTQTRKSPRVYTHAVVATYDREPEAAQVEQHARFNYKQNHKYYVEIANAKPGDKCGRYMDFERTAHEIDEAQQWLETYPTIDAYAAAMVSRFLGRATEQGAQLVMQWSMSERAAVKAIGSWAKYPWYRNVRVVPVQRG